jgi:hypothetical protein
MRHRSRAPEAAYAAAPRRAHAARTRWATVDTFVHTNIARPRQRHTFTSRRSRCSDRRQHQHRLSAAHNAARRSAASRCRAACVRGAAHAMKPRLMRTIAWQHRHPAARAAAVWARRGGALRAALHPWRRAAAPSCSRRTLPGARRARTPSPAAAPPCTPTTTDHHAPRAWPTPVASSSAPAARAAAAVAAAAVAVAAAAAASALSSCSRLTPTKPRRASVAGGARTDASVQHATCWQNGVLRVCCQHVGSARRRAVDVTWRGRRRAARGGRASYYLTHRAASEPAHHHVTTLTRPRATPPRPPDGGTVRQLGVRARGRLALTQLARADGRRGTIIKRPALRRDRG